MAKSKLVKRIEAIKLAQEIGCTGAHQGEDGNWMPCESRDEMERISNIAETSKWRTVVPGYKKSDNTRQSVGKRKRRKARDGWEKLTESPIIGISTLTDGSIVSGTSFSGKTLSCCGEKSIGPSFVRDNDTDVFLDPESARNRSRQLGCIGISRRISKSGRTVWMPCTNMSDYANTTGSTSLGRRNASKRRENEIRSAVRTVLKEQTPTVKRKKPITAELREKK